jgi:hypothetical protein
VFFLFLALIAVLGIGFYLLFVLNLVPGMAEERLGVLEPLPEDLGKWIPDESSEAGLAARAEGLVRETRHYHYEAGSAGKGKLVRQARVRNPETDEIVRVEQEQAVKRRRVRK